jgi:hypothetical protein
MENVALFYGNLGLICGIWHTYIVTFWYALRPFGMFCGHLVYIFPFWYVLSRKLWQP